MTDPVLSLPIHDLNELTDAQRQTAIQGLEQGQVLFYPEYYFSIEANEIPLLSDSLLDGKHKNVSFDYRTGNLGGCSPEAKTALLHDFMLRYALFAHKLVVSTLPQYQNALIWGRTSYRPAEIKGRPSSKRKDDTRLHVDAFPASPVNGKRILRVFCNINPNGKARVWNLGEDFSQVLRQFAPRIPRYNALIARLLAWLKITKRLRSPYDHYMLQTHDRMKLDDAYQARVEKTRFDFPAQSSWIVFTDQVSHAALSGQFLLEQTFYLPVSAMNDPATSPLHQWQQEKKF